jgi:hypothetical protein
MKKIFYDENNFQSTEIEVDNEMLQIIEDIKESTPDALMTDIFVNDKEGKKLSFGVNKATDRTEREIGKRLYRISIEKINP